MKAIGCILFLLLVSGSFFAQTFKGSVTDTEGKPVPYASLFFREKGIGFTADDAGRFAVQLKPGEYRCEISSLGFVQQTVSFNQTESGIEMNIRLGERIYQLQEVSISRNNEDPAYAVMRRAIAWAPYYRILIKSYVANSYLKGSGKMTDVPSVLMLSKDFRKESKAFLNKLFVLEAHNEVSFTAPDIYKTKVKAIKSSFPDNFEMGEGVDLNTVNLYSPLLFGKVSPLGTNAFSFYRFKLEGCFAEGDHLVNKVKVIPKRENMQTLSGYLYIVEDLWCISNAELNLSNGKMMTVHLRTTCKEVRPGVFLPASSSMKCDFSLMGIKGNAAFFSAVNYSHIVLNTTPLHQKRSEEKKESTLKTPGLTAKQRKIQKQLETLASKENLTNGDAYRLAKLMGKQAALTDTAKSANRFERKSYAQVRQTTFDSLASKKDSVYWTTVRSAPLLPEEQLSYLHKDSLKSTKSEQKDSLKNEKKRNKNTFEKVLNVLMEGDVFYADKNKKWLKLYSFNHYIPEFNFVDGWWVGAKVTLGDSLTKKSAIEFTPSAYYATARRNWIWKADLSLYYAPLRNGRLQLRGGIQSADYNGTCGMSPIINMYASLFFARNELKLYEKRFVEFNNRLELANGLQLFAGFGYERRSMLDNHRSTTLFKGHAEPNIPEVPAYRPMPDNEIMHLTAALEYTPAHYYRIYKGRKEYENSRFPTFTLRYEKGFSPFVKFPSPDYNRIDFSINQKLTLGFFNTLAYFINAGTFFHARHMVFPDFKHFDASRFQVTTTMLDGNFCLLDNYQYSTNQRWAQLHLSYQTSYLFLKHFPFLKNKLFDEALHVRSVVVRHLPVHSEAGYSVGLGRLFRIGVFVGFQDKHYQATGFSVNISLDFLKSGGQYSLTY